MAFCICIESISKSSFTDFFSVPPEIRLPNKKIGQSRGKETILECIVQAYPIGVTEWKRNGKKIDQSWKYRSEVYEDDRITITLSLRIMDIGVEDYGIYTCEAENLLGGDAEEMQLYGEMEELYQ